MKRFFYACGAFWLALTKPQMFQMGLMQIVRVMFETLAAAARQKTPLTTKLCNLNTTDDGKPDVLLTLWIGIGEDSNPASRCAELAEKIRKMESEKPIISKAEILSNITLTGTIPTLTNMLPNPDPQNPLMLCGGMRVDIKNLIECLNSKGVIVK